MALKFLVAKYYPYGYRRNSTGDLGTDKLFTGQRLDDTGLYYYNARYYDPEIGRFISPDPLAALGQGLNRYTYSINNPINFLDPSGLVQQVDEDDAVLHVTSMFGGPPGNGEGGGFDFLGLFCWLGSLFFGNGGGGGASPAEPPAPQPPAPQPPGPQPPPPVVTPIKHH